MPSSNKSEVQNSLPIRHLELVQGTLLQNFKKIGPYTRMLLKMRYTLTNSQTDKTPNSQAES